MTQTCLNYIFDIYTLLVEFLSGHPEIKQRNCIGIHEIIQLTLLLNNDLHMEIQTSFGYYIN